MSKFIGYAIAIAEIGIGVATGNPYLVMMGEMMLVSQIVTDLTSPKIPARNASEMTIALGEQPRTMLVGQIAMPGDLRE